MKKVYIGLVLTSLFTVVSFGQRQDTIYQTLLTNITPTIPYTSPTIRNIGQNYHRLTAFFGPAPSKTCTAPGAQVTLQGSFDQFSWVTILGIATQTVSTSLITPVGGNYTTDGKGLYPFIRAMVNSMDTTDCTITLSYSGGLYPTVPDNPSFQQLSELQQVNGSVLSTTTVPVIAALTSIFPTSLSITWYSVNRIVITNDNNEPVIGFVGLDNTTFNCTTPISPGTPQAVVISIPPHDTKIIENSPIFAFNAGKNSLCIQIQPTTTTGDQINVFADLSPVLSFQ